jgi:hypothetical protein
MNYARKGKTWTINECLQLQREYELLEWSIDKIAVKHKRTPEAIMSKIIKEEFVDYEIFENILIYKNKVVEKEIVEDDSGNSNSESESEIEINSDTYNKNDFNDLKNHVKNLEIKLSTMIELIERQNKMKKIINNERINRMSK